MASSLSNLFPLPDEAKTLDVFLGNWDVEGSLTYHSRRFGLKGTSVFSPAAGGWGVSARTLMEIEGLGSYQEADLLCFSRDDGLFHYFAVTNTGAAYDHRGAWADPKSIRFTYEGKQGLGNYSEVLTVKVLGDAQLSIEETDTLEGQTVTQIQAVLRKASPP